MREGPFGVTVTSQTLDKSEPSRKTLDHRPDTIGVGVTHIFTCGERHTHRVVMMVCESVITESMWRTPEVEFNCF